MGTSTISDSLAEELRAQVGSSPCESRELGGSSFHQTLWVRLKDDRELFVKHNSAAPADMFAAEADGLRALGKGSQVRVAEVMAVSERFLALDYLGSAHRRPDFDACFGRALAEMHQHDHAHCGWHRQNYLATLEQDNRALPSWIEFYGQRRLRPLVEEAIKRKLVDASWRDSIDELCARMSLFVDSSTPLSLLHGDLWSGNVHQDDEGFPVLIDPAVYVGHGEVDLAMLQLFGSPSSDFLAAYDEVMGPSHGREERVVLYQLYPLLAHLLLFGGSYRQQCMRAIHSYL